MNLWWGYLHQNNTVQVKRFFDYGDLSEASESPFVKAVNGPFEARDREQAISVCTSTFSIMGYHIKNNQRPQEEP